MIEWLHALWLRLWRRRQLERDLQDEMQFHLEMLAQRHQQEGMTREAAQYAAHRAFGNATALQESNHDLWSFPALEAFVQDLRYGWRQLRRSPGFATVAILTLALGIGATTAIFSLFYTALLRPLPLDHPERIVLLQERDHRDSIRRASVPNFHDWQKQNDVFEAMAALAEDSVAIQYSHDPQRAFSASVSPDFFRVMGARPALGRGFLPGEDQPGHNHVVVLSHALWSSLMHSDPAVIGTSVRIDDQPYTVIGVMPPSFRVPLSGVQAWLPFQPSTRSATHRGYSYLLVFARLKPGISLLQAQSEMSGIARNLFRKYAGVGDAAEDIRLTPLRTFLNRDIQTELFIFMAAALLLLLLATTNVASLLLSKASARQQEAAVRRALGASRWRLLQQTLTENTLLLLLGGAAGWGVAQAAIRGMRAAKVVQPAILPAAGGLGLDPHVLVFTSALCTVAMLLLSVMTALHSSSAPVQDTLKQGGHPSSAGRRRLRTSRSMVIVEVSLGVILLAGAGLLIRSYSRLRQVELGFNPDHVLTMHVDLPYTRYDSHHPVSLFFTPALEKIRALPGVESAALVSTPPLEGINVSGGFAVQGRPDVDQRIGASWKAVSDGYYRTLQIPLMKGRYFTAADRANTDPVVIVNQALAQRVWPNQNPIGQHLQFDTPQWETVIGVVGNVHQSAPGLAPMPEINVPWQQPGFAPLHQSMSFVVRSSVDPATLIKPVEAAILSVDPGQPVSNVTTMNAIVDESLNGARTHTGLIIVFAGAALLLAGIGIFGVTAYAVAERTREIGIRMALGAAQETVLLAVLGQALRLAAIGVVLGLAATLGLTRFLRSMLFGVQPDDPWSLAGAVLLVMIVGLVASYLPACRAARVDPLIALRNE